MSRVARKDAPRRHPAFLPEQTGLHAVRLYRLHFEDGGWALISISDETGMIGIASDWGNWAFNWDPKHIGTRTFTEFLAQSHADYFANKMLGREEYRSFDEPATLSEFRKIVVAERRAREIDKDEARTRWDAIDCYDGGVHLIHDLAHELKIDDYWELIVESHTYTYYSFVECLWPALQSVLRAELAAKRAAVAATEPEDVLAP
jgi:hypothetical protein